MISRRTLSWLLVGLLALPIVLLLLVGLGFVLMVMGDATGARWLWRLVALGGVAWVADVIAIVASVAARHCIDVDDES